MTAALHTLSSSRPLKRLACLGALALAAFHAVLLVRRLAAPEAFDPNAAVRWAGAAALLGGLFSLRRALTGRQAFALGLAVLLLHVPAPARDAEAAPVEQLLAALPVLLPALGLLLLARLRAGAPVAPARRGLSLRLARRARPRFQLVEPLSPRPPPRPVPA